VYIMSIGASILGDFSHYLITCEIYYLSNHLEAVFQNLDWFVKISKFLYIR